MPLHINHETVTITRDGARVKVKPTGAPFDFTEAEVEAVRAAGGRMDPQGPAKIASVVTETKPEVTSKPAKGRKAKQADDNEEDEDL